jgi:hypothetical protein
MSAMISGGEAQLVEQSLQRWFPAGQRSLCPRPPRELKARMQEPRFAALQRRRSQTEARISILKRGFLGQPLRARGFAHRQLAVAWGVLTHNLWVFARPGHGERRADKKFSARR